MESEKRTALVRRPSPRLADGLVTHIDRSPVDPGLAARQHEAYVAALRSAGWRVQELPAADDLPDAVFVEDTVVVCDGLAMLARPGAPERRGEVASVERAVTELGLEIARIDEEATLDGGDVLQVGTTVYVGRSGRTNEDAICLTARILGARGRHVVPVEVRGCLHLKTAMTALPDGTLIGNPDWVDTSVLPGLRVAPEPSGAHVVVLGEKQVLIAASAPRTADRLRDEGYDVSVVDISEFEKMEGCVTCLSVRVPLTGERDRFTPSSSARASVTADRRIHGAAPRPSQQMGPIGTVRMRSVSLYTVLRELLLLSGRGGGL